jgi:hypothetical protein
MSGTHNNPIHEDNLHFTLLNPRSPNKQNAILLNNANNEYTKNRVINAKEFFTKNYKKTLNCISETLGILTNIYKFSEKLKKETNDIKKEILVNKLTALKHDADIKMNETYGNIIDITRSIQNSMIDYPNFNINDTDPQLLKKVEYLYTNLNEKNIQINDDLIDTKTKLTNIKKKTNQMSRHLQLQLIEKLSNNLENLTKEREDLRYKLLILNDSIRILTLDPDSLNTGIEIALNTFKTRQNRELAKKMVKDKEDLLAQYIQIIGNIRSTNKKTRRTTNLSGIYDEYKKKIKELNSNLNIITLNKELSKLKRLTQKIKGTSLNGISLNGTSLNSTSPKGTSLNSTSLTPNSTRLSNNWKNFGSPYPNNNSHKKYITRLSNNWENFGSPYPNNNNSHKKYITRLN